MRAAANKRDPDIEILIPKNKKTVMALQEAHYGVQIYAQPENVSTTIFY
jgi:hypothetical protein